MTLKVHISPKSIWLFVLMLLSVDLWYVHPFSFVLSSVGIFIYLGWLCLGHFFFKPRRAWLKLSLSADSNPTRLIYLGVLLSFIPSLLYFGQNPFISFLTTRSTWSLLSLPLLLVVKPSEKDIRMAVSAFVYVFLAVTIMDSILDLPILDRNMLIPEGSSRPYIDSDEYVHLLEGYWWVVVALAFKLGDLKKTVDVVTLIHVLVLIAVMYVLQNRTMLAASLGAVSLTFLTLKGKNMTNTIAFRSCAAFILIIMLFILSSMSTDLIEQTITELGDSRYNRALALVYFLTEAPDTLLKVILGNGFISAKVSSHMQDLMSGGIYNSDVGLIGMWNYYGLLPVATVLYYQIKALLSRGSQHYYRCLALCMLIGMLTVCCYTDPSKILWLCVFFYLWKFQSY